MKYLKSKEKGLETFAEELCTLMVSFVRRAMRWDNNHLSRGLITLPQLHVLFYLSTSDYRLMSDVAKEMGIKGSTLTAMMDKLVTLGFVSRLSGENDRRTVLVSITAKGRKMLEGLKEDRKKTIIRVFRNLSPAERQTYIDIIRKVVMQAGSDEVSGKG